MMKIFVYFKSMKFGITLLVVIMLISIIGTVIPQGLEEAFYRSNYTPFASNIIILFNLNDIYNSILFGVLFVMLVVNLSLCSFIRLGKIVGKSKNFSINNMELVEVESNLEQELNIAVENKFKLYGFNTFLQDKASEKYCSVKNKKGYYGSWLLHFGILLVIVCYTYGNITYFSEGVYGVPGTVQELKGTNYNVKINDFNISYGEGNIVSQYKTTVDIMDSEGKVLKSSHAAVNEPLRFEGYNFYQTGYGWATKFNISKSGSSLFQETVYEKTSIQIPSEGIGIYFNRFFPDFAANNHEFITLSDEPNNPVVLFTIIYKGEIVKMDFMSENETVKWNDFEFTFYNPQRYSYLEVNKMNGQLGALIGGILIVAGLLLVFYLKPTRMVIYHKDGSLYIYKELIKNYKKTEENQKENNIYAG